jgi:Mn-dependent DtxR family transcriptional regulator
MVLSSESHPRSEWESEVPLAGGPETHPYPARDYLCLDCVVAGECNPQSQLCLWRADRSEDPLRPREAQLLYAVTELARRGRVPSVREVAQLVGVSATAASARIERAMKAGLVARGCAQHDERGVSLTALGERRLVEAENRQPELALNAAQRGYYQLLATVRDLEAAQVATGRPVTASAVGSALGRRRRAVAATLRRLGELELVACDFGRVSLTDAGRQLLQTLRAYTVNMRLGPRVAIQGRGQVRVRYLRRRRSE